MLPIKLILKYLNKDLLHLLPGGGVVVKLIFYCGIRNHEFIHILSYLTCVANIFKVVIKQYINVSIRWQNNAQVQSVEF